MSLLSHPSREYFLWLAKLKQRIQSAQQRATLSVNREMVLLYWHVGRDILERQQAQGLGAKIVDQLSPPLDCCCAAIKTTSRWSLPCATWPNPRA